MINQRVSLIKSWGWQLTYTSKPLVNGWKWVFLRAWYAIAFTSVACSPRPDYLALSHLLCHHWCVSGTRCISLPAWKDSWSGWMALCPAASLLRLVEGPGGTCSRVNTRDLLLASPPSSFSMQHVPPVTVAGSWHRWCHPAWNGMQDMDIKWLDGFCSPEQSSNVCKGCVLLIKVGRTTDL